MKFTYTLHDLQCQDCIIKVKESLHHLPEIITVDISLEKNEIVIEANQPLTVVRVNQILEKIGKYRVSQKGDAMNHEKKTKYTVADFFPLIIIFSIIIALTALKQWYEGWCLVSAMSDFMGFFFVIFGSFKIVNLKGFAEAYSTYDLIAQRSTLYAYLYPFIELGLGIAYLARLYPTATNIITLVIMLISSLGVANELRKKKTIMCACLGVVFKIPMTYVTLAEDLLMAAMAACMLMM